MFVTSPKTYRASYKGTPGICTQGPLEREWTWYPEVDKDGYHIHVSEGDPDLVIGEEVYVSSQRS